MENKDLSTVTKKAEKIYRNEKSKGYTDTEIARKYYLLHRIAVKMGNPFLGTTPRLTDAQALALYSMQPVLYKVHRIASTDK